ncbi:MAG TPA: hypothetical protein DEO88_08960 [Syntrophobacteraceae bacterium]|nr:hypothetical protein [Syntrophobacteraceae bacterium]
MRAFGRWLMLALCLFGLTAGGYHAYLGSHPKKVLVILDTSYPMGAVWEQVPAVLASLAGSRYAVFALASDKGRIHGWQASLELGRAVPYAPRNLKDLRQQLQFPELTEASEIYLITNAPPKEISTSTGWKIIHLEQTH